VSAEAIEAARQSILTWCEEEGFAADQTTIEGVDFACKVYVHDNPQFRVMVTRSPGETKLVAATGIRFDDAMRLRLLALDPEAMASVMVDLAWLMNSHPVSFEVNRDGMVPSSVLIAKPIYDDQLSKTSLMSAIAELRRIANLVILQLEKSTRTPASSLGVSRQTSPNGCPSCGSPLKPGAAFCAKCGARLGAAAAKADPKGAPVATGQGTQGEQAEPSQQISPDGHWRWDGAAWVPNAAASQRKANQP
jgi:Uncharacterized conserved protein